MSREDRNARNGRIKTGIGDEAAIGHTTVSNLIYLGGVSCNFFLHVLFSIPVSRKVSTGEIHCCEICDALNTLNNRVTFALKKPNNLDAVRADCCW